MFMSPIYYAFIAFLHSGNVSLKTIKNYWTLMSKLYDNVQMDQ